VQLEVANSYNTATMAALENMTPSPVDFVPLRGFRWAPFRFGVEFRGVFGAAKAPLEAAAVAISSEHVYFAGCAFCLDVKRFRAAPDGADNLAVYLRRKPLVVVVRSSLLLLPARAPPHRTALNHTTTPSKPPRAATRRRRGCVC